MIFDPRDHDKLIAEPTAFTARPGASNYERTVVRNALALEITAQLVRSDAAFHHRGGTPLQAGDRRAIFLNNDLMRLARPDEVRRVIVAPVDRDNWLVRLIRTAPGARAKKRSKARAR